MKAKITKKDGTTIELEGSAEEVARIVEPPAPQFTFQPQVKADPSIGKFIDELMRQPKDPGFWQYPQIVYNDMCLGGGAHDYPAVWNGIFPPPCSKCGKSSGPTLGTTIVSSQTISGSLVENGTKYATATTLPQIPFVSGFTIVNAETQS